MSSLHGVGKDDAMMAVMHKHMKMLKIIACTIINYTLDLTMHLAGCYLSCSVNIPQNYFAITLFIPHRENIIPQFAMDGVREKLAVVVFLVCWNSQVEAQGQGKQLYH